MEFKEGQTYVCKKTNKPWWNEGNEYTVCINLYDELVIYDDLGIGWHDYELDDKEHVLKLKEEKQMNNLIDNQAHYKNQGIEPIDLMRANMTKEQFYGFLLGNSQKYLSRHEQKNGVEDLKKCITYISWMIDEWENGNKNKEEE